MAKTVKKADPKLPPKPPVKTTSKSSSQSQNNRAISPQESAKSSNDARKSMESNAKPKLWGEHEIKVIGLTGEYRSGKTLWGLLVCPDSTIVYDLEMSSNTYPGIYKTRVDVMSELAAMNIAPTPLSIFTFVFNHMKTLKTGEYAVVFVDPASDFEMGLVDFVADKYRDFGFNSRDGFMSTKGIFHNHVSAWWKGQLSMLSQKCESFIFTTHMRNKWVGGKPTSIREAKGRPILTELAALYIQLSRFKDGKEIKEPWGRIIKSRLASYKVKDGKVQGLTPILPPTMPVCTPDEVRKYLASPPDFNKLKAGEKTVVESLSDDEKKQLDEIIESTKLARAEIELEKAQLDEKSRQFQQRKDEIKNGKQPSKDEAEKQETKKETTAKAEKSMVDTQDKKTETKSGDVGVVDVPDPSPDKSGPITKPQISEIIKMVKLLNYPTDAFKAAVDKKYGVPSATKLSQNQAAELIRSLSEKLDDKAKAAQPQTAEAWAESALK